MGVDRAGRGGRETLEIPQQFGPGSSTNVRSLAPFGRPICYSARSASTGSIRVTLRAGRYTIDFASTPDPRQSMLQHEKPFDPRTSG
jgi:hypothetical protein